MVKTTINLRDDIYKKLVRETVEKYGNSKNLSRLINEKLEKAEGETLAKVDSDDIKERLRIVKESAGSWKLRKSGRKYVKEIRAGWERRLRTMAL
jgi:predicted CopG family antitoxin